MRYSCEANPSMGADSTEIHDPVRDSGVVLIFEYIREVCRHANKHTKATDNEEIPICQGCGRFTHRRDICDLSDHPDFNRSGDWVGSAAKIAIRAFGRRTQPNTPIPLRVKLFKHLRADGTKIPKTSQQRPSTPPMDTNTRRDHDDHSGGRGDTGGRGNRDPRRQGGRGKVAFDRSIYSGKGTQCLADIATHLSCNCGESDINSSYRQCLISMRSSTTYFTALTLFDTYTSFVNREVAKWLEQQDDGEPSPKISRHDKPTTTVG